MADQRSCRGRLVWNERFREYDFGPHHPLRPERFRYGLDLLQESGLWQPDTETVEAPEADPTELALVHAPEYIAVVQAIESGGMVEPGAIYGCGLGPGDNPAFHGAHATSALIAGGTLRAARQVMDGEYDHAFNPAGGLHHAMRARASGFCVYNDVAVAIAAILRQYDARVLYLDFDAHHGDGVQALFYDEPRVVTFSIHETGRHLFPGTGFVDEVGNGPGYGTSFNAPMEPFTQDLSWYAAVETIVPVLAERFKPDIIVSQHGCDGHTWDPLTHLAITTATMDRQARLTHDLAHTYCDGRWIGSGGGGYDYRRVVPRMYAVVFSQMTARPLPAEIPATWRDRWASTSPDPLPTRFVDPPADFPPAHRAAEITQCNAATVAQLRDDVLPLLKPR